MDHQQAIDDLAAAFFAAFTNAGGRTPDLARLDDLFLPGGVIVKTTAAGAEASSVAAFIAPRAKLLTDGTLVDFSEHEVEARTTVLGHVAQRTSIYRKSGVLSGVPFAARGVKVFTFARSDTDWRIVSVTWDDEREGFTPPEAIPASTASPGSGPTRPAGS
jgi:hypothetical protein